MKTDKYENNEYYRMQNLPYEKFISYGSRALTDSELLAILLRTGTRGISACELGEEVLTRTAGYGNGLSGLYHIPLGELRQIDGIGKVKAIQLKTIAELSTRMAQAKAKDGLSFCGRTPWLPTIWNVSGMRMWNISCCFSWTAACI